MSLVKLIFRKPCVGTFTKENVLDGLRLVRSDRRGAFLDHARQNHCSSPPVRSIVRIRLKKFLIEFNEPEQKTPRRVASGRWIAGPDHSTVGEGRHARKTLETQLSAPKILNT